MLTPVLVGLPGSGKSTLAAAIADRLGVCVFGSDHFFRECRALPSDSPDSRRVIAERFLARVSRDHPDLAEVAKADVAASGSSPLVDGKRFRRVYGEAVFRVFEIEMLAWAHETSLLGASLPDLSASAPLYEENRRLFSRERGYVPILIEVPRRVIVARVLADYETYVAAGEEGKPITIRGQYEGALDLIAERSAGAGERASELALEAARLTEDAARKRMSCYAAYAEFTFRPPIGAPPAEAANGLIRLVERIAKA